MSIFLENFFQKEIYDKIIFTKGNTRQFLVLRIVRIIILKTQIGIEFCGSF